MVCLRSTRSKKTLCTQVMNFCAYISPSRAATVYFIMGQPNFVFIVVVVIIIIIATTTFEHVKPS